MKFQIVRLEYSYPNHSKKIAMMYKFREEVTSNHYQVPIVSIVPIFFQFLYFIQLEMSVNYSRLMLLIPQVIFVLSLGKIFCRKCVRQL